MKKLIPLILVFCLASGTANAALVSHWAFDEGQGTIAYDSANGYNGTIHGASRTEGILGGALDFDGINDYVDFGDIDEFDFGNNDFSICAWFYTQGVHSIPLNVHQGRIVAKYDYGGNQRQWNLTQLEDGTVKFYTSPDGSTHEQLYSTAGGQNQWVHMTAVRDGSMKYIYINGVLDVSDIMTGLRSGTYAHVYVGCNENEGFKGHFFNGLIDDIRIYNHALSPAEIQQLIPEPASLLLLCLGGLSLRRRK
jgi:hypothetical protein